MSVLQWLAVALIAVLVAAGVRLLLDITRRGWEALRANAAENELPPPLRGRRADTDD